MLVGMQAAMASVFEKPRLKLISIMSAIGIVSCFPIYVFFFSESQFSNAVFSWQAAFKASLLTTGEVRLHSLVKFQSERIFLIEAYDRFDLKTESQLFSHENWFDPFWFWWRGDERYWTIAYQRNNKAPFLIRLNKNEWDLRQQTKLSTADPEAKLVLSQSEPSRGVYCARPWARCLALSDRESTR